MASGSDARPVRKVGYARVSTADQNPDMQIAALKAYGVPEELMVDRRGNHSHAYGRSRT